MDMLDTIDMEGNNATTIRYLHMLDAMNGDHTPTAIRFSSVDSVVEIPASDDEREAINLPPSPPPIAEGRAGRKPKPILKHPREGLPAVPSIVIVVSIFLRKIFPKKRDHFVS
jgi:hypothetical protein